LTLQHQYNRFLNEPLARLPSRTARPSYFETRRRWWGRRWKVGYMLFSPRVLASSAANCYRQDVPGTGSDFGLNAGLARWRSINKLVQLRTGRTPESILVAAPAPEKNRQRWCRYRRCRYPAPGLL